MSGGVKGGLGWGRISCSRLLLQRCRRAITHQIGLILVAQEWQRCKICSGFEVFRLKVRNAKYQIEHPSRTQTPVLQVERFRKPSVGKSITPQLYTIHQAALDVQ